MRRFIAVASSIVGFALPALGQTPPPVAAPPVTQPVVPTAPTAAQAAAAALGRNVTNAEIAEAIKSSGLTESQLRARLQQSGYDPRLADPFFATSGSGTTTNTPPNAAFIQALQDLGIASDLTAGQGNTEPRPEGAVERADPEKVAGGRSGVFGKSMFSPSSTMFEPTLNGPVDASYRVGVGDQLQVILTGDVELAFAVDVRRDGTVVVPTVGQIPVAGLTLESARSLLTRSAARVYSGIDRGRVKTDIAISKVRNNLTFLMGEVERPGAYQVNALSTVFYALSRAGGPTTRGSFRNVEVRRGNVVVKKIDLYDYLLQGDASNDIRTEQGDIIFVPLNTRAVAVSGAVRRAGVFELKPGEGFADLARFAGGFLASASLSRIQIDRILPPEKRSPGVDRVVIDIDASTNRAAIDTLTLNDNDIITVASVGDLRRNSVTLRGEVFQPGMFEWRGEMTLAKLLERAEGTLPWALLDRVKVERNVVASGRTESFSLDVRDTSGANFLLHEFDRITVLDGRRVFPAGTVTIDGEVNTPGTRPFVERQSLRDLIDLAGGFKEAAANVELVRRKVGAAYSDTSSIITRYAIGPNGTLPPEAERLLLERFDRVFIRPSPGFRSLGTVSMVGLFTYPGTYALETENERLSALIRRAGGTLPHAYLQSFRMFRLGRLVPIDFAGVMRHDPEDDIALKAGDQLQIDASPGVVNVTGAVERQVSVPYNRRWGLDQYIDAAGGPAINANTKSVVVSYVNGSLARRRRLRSDPKVQEGATITVGAKPAPTETNWGDVLTKSVQVFSLLASLAIGYMAATRK